MICMTKGCSGFDESVPLLAATVAPPGCGGSAIDPVELEVAVRTTLRYLGWVNCSTLQQSEVELSLSAPVDVKYLRD